MADFIAAHKLVSQWEGDGLTDDPVDKGGRTYAGISEKAHPDWLGWDMLERGNYDKNELRRLAEGLYKTAYWHPLQCDLIESQKLATILYGAAVNIGVGLVAKWLQAECNVRLDKPIKIDGVIGNYTLNALHDLKDQADELCEGMIARQKMHYYAIVERDATQRKFLRGWINRAKAFA